MIDWKETYQVIDSDTLRLAENAPMFAPTIVASNDTARKFNNLLGKSFQFAYQWVYKDYRYSVLSPYSQIYVSSDLFANAGNTYSESADNTITISFPTGNTEVLQIRVLAREGNSGGWFVCQDVPCGEPVETDGVFIEGYKTVTFYNDVAREYLDLTSATATYHNVPQKAKNLEVIKNTLSLSNCVTGYDPTIVNYNMGVTYAESTITETKYDVMVSQGRKPWFVFSAHTAEVFINVNELINDYSLFLNYEWKYDLIRKTVNVGEVSFSISRKFDFPTAKTASELADYLVTFFNENSSFDLFIEVDGQPEPKGHGDMKVTAVKSKITDALYIVTLSSPVIDGTGSGDVFSNTSWKGVITGGQNTFKSYSSYNAGVCYYDKVGRTSGVLTSASKSIYIPGKYERVVGDRDKSAFITWSLNHTPPDWAVYYRMCVSESVNLLSVFPVHTPATNAAYKTNYQGRSVLAIDVLGATYVYVQGDYLLLEAEPNVIKPIIGFSNVITDGTDQVFGNFVYVQEDTNAIADYEDQTLYIHRPRLTTSDVVYYEDFNTYEVVDGAHSVTSGTLGGGDAWIAARNFQKVDPGGTTLDYADIVEDFVLNELYGVRAYSQGRPVVSLKDFGQKRQQIQLWGGTYFKDTKTNEISAFNFTDSKQYDDRFGEINQMVLVGDVLKVIQEQKETSVYVGKSVFTDAGGNVQLAQVDSLFGNTNASDEQFGTSHKKSAKVNKRSLYYWDQRLGSVIRSSPNGQVDIGRLGLTKYFQDIRRLIDAGTEHEMLFGFDRDHNELLVSFKVGNTIDTVIFDEDNNRWMTFADYYLTVGGVKYAPDLYASYANNTLSFVSGHLYQLEQNNASNALFNGSSKVEIVGVASDAPTIEKMYKDMSVDADGVFYVNTETPKSPTAPYGMSTYSVPSFFRKKSGRMYAPFLRNVNIASGVDNNLVYMGRQMQGRYAKLTITSPSPMGTLDNPNSFEFRDMQVNCLPV